MEPLDRVDSTRVHWITRREGQSLILLLETTLNLDDTLCALLVRLQDNADLPMAGDGGLGISHCYVYLEHM